jgi:hypothetical protein
MSNEKEAGLFWGKNIRKERMIPPTDLVKVEKILANKQQFTDQLEEVSKYLAEVEASPVSNPKIVNMVKEFENQFKSTIKMLVSRGMWPQFNATNFQSYVQSELGLQPKKAAKGDVQETTLHNLDRFAKVFPQIALSAYKVVNEMEDPNYLNELKRLVHDVFFGDSGLHSQAQKIHDVLNADMPKGTTEDTQGTSTKAAKIKWFHEEGAEGIADALRSQIMKKRPKDESLLPQFNEEVKKIEGSTITKEWQGRIVKALKEHGFGLDGEFNPSDFEKSLRKYDALKLAAEEPASLNFFKEMQGTYKAYTKALEHYKDDPKMKNEVVNSYYLIVLEGQKNAYSALEDYHKQLKTLGTNPVSTEGVKPAQESKSEEDKKVEESKPEEGKKVDDKPADESAPGEKDVQELSEVNERKSDIFADAIRQREDRDVVMGLADAITKRMLFGQYHKQGMPALEKAAITKKVLETAGKLKGKIIVPEEFMEDTQCCIGNDFLPHQQPFPCLEKWDGQQ